MSRPTRKRSREEDGNVLESQEWVNNDKPWLGLGEGQTEDCVTTENIYAASKRIEKHVVRTPCFQSHILSKTLGCNIFIKHDSKQVTGSFKERGAVNALISLSPAQRKKGVVAASAGNHALALAYHGGRLGIPVTVVMPHTAPLIKRVRCEELGATVRVMGNSFDEATAIARRAVDEEDLTYIHGFNDERVIAGQGSLGHEILEQVPYVDAIVVPCGGGGLLAGIALSVKHERPEVEVVGVEPENVASMITALREGKPVLHASKPTIADGLAVSTVGGNTLSLTSRYVDRVITVDEHSIALAVLRLVEMEKVVTEGAGATALAALLANRLTHLAGKNVVLLVCGGNIDVTLLGRLIDHGLTADGRLIRLSCTISDRPGGLADFTKIVASAGAAVKDIQHDRSFTGDTFAHVLIHCTLETRDAAHGDVLWEALEREGFHPTIHSFNPHRPVVGRARDGAGAEAGTQDTKRRR